MRRLLFSLLTLSLSGCMNIVPSNMADVINALGKDQASVGMVVQTPWGTATFCRSNSPGAEFGCGTLVLRNGTISTVPMILWNGTGPKPQFIAPAQ